MEVIRTYRIGGKCPYCMEEHDVKVLRGEETTIFKGENISFIAEYDYCDKADEYYARDEQINQNNVSMKNAYRKKVGLLTGDKKETETGRKSSLAETTGDMEDIEKDPEEEKSRIQKAFDKEVKDYRLSLMQYRFITNGRINARGRLYFKVMTLLLCLIYIITDSNMVEVVTYLSIMSLILPPLVDIVTKVIIEKQNINSGNLYDMLYAFGLYVITLAPAVGLGIFFMKKIKEAVPGIYESFSGFPLYASLLAAVFIGIDIITLLIMNAKEKKGGN